MPFNAELGADDANSLLTVEAADAYFELGLGGTAWAALEPETKEQALVSATREFETLCWQGDKVTTTQALAFPRRWPGVSDGVTIPSKVAAALCEHALALATADPSGSERMQMRAEGVLSWSQGNRAESLAPLSFAAQDASESLSGKVVRLLRGWIRRGGTMDSGRRPAYPAGNYDRFGQWWPTELM